MGKLVVKALLHPEQGTQSQLLHYNLGRNRCGVRETVWWREMGNHAYPAGEAQTVGKRFTGKETSYSSDIHTPKNMG
jgi:hypothetical protein